MMFAFTARIFALFKILFVCHENNVYTYEYICVCKAKLVHHEPVDVNVYDEVLEF